MFQRLLMVVVRWFQGSGLRSEDRDFLIDSLSRMTLNSELHKESLGCFGRANLPVPSIYMVARAARMAYDVPDETLLAFLFHPDAVCQVRQILKRTEDLPDDWSQCILQGYLEPDFWASTSPLDFASDPGFRRARRYKRRGYPDQRRWRQSCLDAGKSLRELTCSR